MGHYMRQFIHELKLEAEMSNDHAVRIAKAEFEAEQQRKRRGLLAGSFNESGNHLNWPKLDIGAVPKIDLATGKVIPSEPYKEPEPRIGTERTRKADAKVSANVKHAHYFKDVSALKEIDIYAVCQLFGVNDPSGATQHAVKKLLMSGQRGVKDAKRDLQEAADTLARKLQMMEGAA